MLKGERYLVASKIEATRKKIIDRITVIKDAMDKEKKKEKENEELAKKQDEINTQIECLGSDNDENIVCE
jgi:cell division protein FtsB